MKVFAAILAAVLVTSACFTVGIVRAASVWTDTFTDSTINGYTSRWDLWQFGVGNPTTGTVAVDVGNDRLVMTITGGASNSENTCGYGVKLKDTILKLQGDFVIQVHYEIFSWNLANPYCRCAIGVVSLSEDTWIWGERISENPHYGIDSHFQGSPSSVLNDKTTTATSGDIRLVRVGSIVTEYYKDSTVSDWTASGYSNQGTGDMLPQLGFWVWYPGQSSASGSFQVAFSDFEVVSNSGSGAPPVSAGPDLLYIALALVAVVVVVALVAFFLMRKRRKV